MRYDPYRHHRRSIRLKGYDYTQAGMYFITICTYERTWLFGEVSGEEMRVNAFGEIVQRCWAEIPQHFAHVALDAFVVMPNHVHGILVLTHDGEEERPVWSVPNDEGLFPRGARPRSVGAIVGSFKSATARRINELRGAPGAPVWQRNYYERIIRDEHELDRIRRYIVENPLRWHLDRENPWRTGIDPEDASWFQATGHGTNFRER